MLFRSLRDCQKNPLDSLDLYFYANLEKLYKSLLLRKGSFELGLRVVVNLDLFL